MSPDVPELPPALAALVASLVAEAGDARSVTLDAVGDAVGARAVSQDDLERVLDALERAGVVVRAPEGGGGQARLIEVVRAARTLRAAGAGTPKIADIARASGLREAEVREALFLATILQRGT